MSCGRVILMLCTAFIRTQTGSAHFVEMYESVFDCNLCNIKRRKSDFSAIIY